MATLTKGKTFTNGELVTPQKLHELVDLGSVANIVNADISAAAAIADTKLAQITTAGKVANSATTATNASTPNAIVARDGSGNFSAGTITANLTGNVTGNASTATTATNALAVIQPFTQPTTFVVNSSSDAVRITQTGTGKCLSVEDSTNPDASPFVVDTNGSVGIGTATPTAKLHVESTGFSGARALFKSSDAGNYITVQGVDAVGTNDSAFINFEDGDIAHGAFIGLTGQATGQSGNLRFYTGGNAGGTRMVITRFGNVGIGIAEPTAKLHVESTGFSGARALFRSVDSGNYITIQGADAAGINDSAYVSFSDGNDANVAFIGITGQNQGQSGDFRIFTGGNTGGERMRITKQGKIRVTLPTYANNAAAITGGLVTNDMYKTATGELRIVV
jgi:hypothetical protein